MDDLTEGRKQAWEQRQALVETQDKQKLGVFISIQELLQEKKNVDKG